MGIHNIRYTRILVKPIKAKLGPVTSDQAQRAKPTKAQNDFIKIWKG